MNITEGDLRKHAEKRAQALASIRKPWETGNFEVARFCQRWLSPYITRMGSGAQTNSVDGVRQQGGQANNRLYNGTAVKAARTLANGMSSGLSSPSQPWFKFKLDDPTLSKVHAVKEWIDDTTALLYAFLAQTNIYTAMQFGYRELGLFGVEATAFLPHWKYGAVAYPLTFGEYWLGQDDGLRVDTLIRDTSMAASSVVARWGDKACRKTRQLVKDDKGDQTISIRHVIEPNADRSHGKLDNTNMPFRSYYFEVNAEAEKDGQKPLLEVSGYRRFPVATPRWESYGTEVYSAGPGFDALPDARKLQLQELRYQQAQDYIVRPPLEMPVANRNNGANLIPGGITWSAAQDLGSGGARAMWQVPAQALPAMAEDMMNRTEPAINDSFFTPLFDMFGGISGTTQRTAEEVIRRHEDRLALLGPVVDRVQNEKLANIVLQAFDILSRAGRLPPAPPELQGVELSIEFVSVLAQAQKMMGLGAMERYVGFIGNIAGVKPAILDKPDFDFMVTEYGERLGVPARSIRPDEDVAADRQAQAQAAQQEKMAAMAPALESAAAGAELLSRTDANAGLLPRLLPQPGA